MKEESTEYSLCKKHKSFETSAFTRHVYLQIVLDNNVQGLDIFSLIKCSATSFQCSSQPEEEDPDGHNVTVILP